MQTQLGLVHFWQQGDLVTHATAILLLLLSIGSWALIVGRFARQLRINLACDRAPEAFWQARNLNDALAAIDAADRTGLFAGTGFPPLVFSAAVWLRALLAIGLMAVIVGLLPALRAQRLSIVDALAGR